MKFDIEFAGGLRVDAISEDGTVIRTDQSKDSGGDGSAPEPYSLFLASIGTCAGVYVLKFCRAHGLPLQGVRLEQESYWDEKKRRLSRVEIRVVVPPSFPEKHRKALARSAGLCAVKKAMLDPPEFHVETRVDA